jgi:hypothetical protein
VNNTKRHHWLVAGKVFVLVPAGENTDEKAMIPMELNAMLMTDEKVVTARDMGRSQVALQMRAHQKIGSDENATMQDVVILSINYLGAMTEEEFQPPQPAEETQLAN